MRHERCSLPDPDVLFVARSLVRRYGDEAKRHALERIATLLERLPLLARGPTRAR